MPPPKTERPDYGLDAPGVVRNLFLVGAVGLLVGVGAVFDLLPAPLAGVGFSCGVTFAVTGAWMVYSSKVGKLRARERLLNRISWTGGEQVLDVGCGRGLMLIGVARRLTT